MSFPGTNESSVQARAARGGIVINEERALTPQRANDSRRTTLDIRGAHSPAHPTAEITRRHPSTREPPHRLGRPGSVRANHQEGAPGDLARALSKLAEHDLHHRRRLDGALLPFFIDPDIEDGCR